MGLAIGDFMVAIRGETIDLLTKGYGFRWEKVSPFYVPILPIEQSIDEEIAGQVEQEEDLSIIFGLQDTYVAGNCISFSEKGFSLIR